MEKKTIKSTWEAPVVINLDIDQTETHTQAGPTETFTADPGS